LRALLRVLQLEGSPRDHVRIGGGGIHFRTRRFEVVVDADARARCGERRRTAARPRGRCDECVFAFP
jgi:hypothetical protein